MATPHFSDPGQLLRTFGRLAAVVWLPGLVLLASLSSGEALRDISDRFASCAPSPRPGDSKIASEMDRQELPAAVRTSFWGRNEVSAQDVGRYRILKRLGSGAQGGVYLAFDNHAGCLVALKKITDPFRRGKRYALRALRELTFLRAINSEYVVKIRHAFLPADKLGFKSVYFAMDAMEGSFGSKAVRASATALSHEQQVRVAYHMLKGLVDLHSAGVVHQDIHVRNVLVDADCRVKLADLGCSTAMHTKAPDPQVHRPRRFISARPPELINRGALDYGWRADVWAMGCAILEALSPLPALFCHANGGMGRMESSVVKSLLETFGMPKATVLSKYSRRVQSAMRVLTRGHNITTSPVSPLDKVHAGQIGAGLLRVLSSMLTLDPDERQSPAQLLRDSAFAHLGGLPPVAIGMSARVRAAVEGMRRLQHGESVSMAQLREMIYDEIRVNYRHAYYHKSQYH